MIISLCVYVLFKKVRLSACPRPSQVDVLSTAKRRITYQDSRSAQRGVQGSQTAAMQSFQLHFLSYAPTAQK